MNREFNPETVVIAANVATTYGQTKRTLQRVVSLARKLAKTISAGNNRDRARIAAELLKATRAQNRTGATIRPENRPVLTVDGLNEFAAALETLISAN